MEKKKTHTHKTPSKYSQRPCWILQQRQNRITQRHDGQIALYDSSPASLRSTPSPSAGDDVPVCDWWWGRSLGLKSLLVFTLHSAWSHKTEGTCMRDRTHTHVQLVVQRHRLSYAQAVLDSSVQNQGRRSSKHTPLTSWGNVQQHTFFHLQYDSVDRERDG